MGGCDGGLAHRWPDLTVPQWPTEEAHRCSLASPPPLPRTPPLSLRPCPAPHPRVTHAHTWSSATRSRRQGLEPAAPGSQRAGGPHLPKVSSSGSLCPAAPRPLLAGPGLAAWPPALPACPPAPSTSARLLPAGLPLQPPAPGTSAVAFALARCEALCVRVAGGSPRRPQAFVRAGRGQGAGRGRTLPPPPTPGGAQEGDGGRVDRLSPPGVTNGRPHQPGPRAGLPWALADCTRPGRWVREGTGPREMVHGLIPALPLCDLRQLSDPLWASSAVPCGRRLAARRGGRGGGVRWRGVVSHRPRGRGGGRVAWGVWGCPWRSCASGPSARPLGVPGRVWLLGRAGGRPCGGGPDAPFSCSPGLRDAQGSQPASF